MLYGDNMGSLRMYGPPVFAEGSSVAHWTTEAKPDLLMEPAVPTAVYNQVDLTVAAMADIGWSVNFPSGDPFLIFGDGFESPPP